MKGEIEAMLPSEILSADKGSLPRFHRRRRVISIGLVAVLAASGMLYLLFAKPRDNQSPAKQPHAALTVTSAAPRRVIWPDTLIAQGVVAPWEEARVGTQIGSYQLIEVRANVGDQVKRGQVLARLNPALLEAEEAQLLARHAQAVANDRRARGLQEAGGISDQDALQFATEAKTAAALLAAKQLELRYTSILAPDDGVISARTATTGAVVPAGEELFRLIRKNRLEWRGELTAAQIKVARRGQAIRLSLSDGTDAQARIREFAPSLDGTSRLGIAYADILTGSRARAGMYVSGAIAVGESSALVVPAECVVIRDGRSYVLLLVTPGKTSMVALHAVTTGRREGDDVEIAQGLSGKERLIRRGAAFLDDDDVVSVADAGKSQP